MKPFHDMSGPELQDAYSEMLATADDLGYKVPDELLYDGDDADRLMTVCTELDAAITKFRAGVDKKDEADAPVSSDSRPKTKAKAKPKASTPPASSTGTQTRSKAAKPETGSTSRPKPPKKAAAAEPVKPQPDTKAKAPTRISPPKKVAKSEPATMPKTGKKESDMSAAKKASAKKTAKKTVAKKATAKKTARKAAPAKKTAARNTARGFAENAKIKVLLDENPCRAGTPRYDRVTNLFKHDGKLVKDFLAKGGKSGTVSYSAKMGWIKVV